MCLLCDFQYCHSFYILELKYKTGVKETVLIFKDQRQKCFYLSILNMQEEFPLTLQNTPQTQIFWISCDWVWSVKGALVQKAEVR